MVSDLFPLGGIIFSTLGAPVTYRDAARFELEPIRPAMFTQPWSWVGMTVLTLCVLLVIGTVVCRAMGLPRVCPMALLAECGHRKLTVGRAGRPLANVARHGRSVTRASTALVCADRRLRNDAGRHVALGRLGIGRPRQTWPFQARNRRPR